VGGWPWVFGDDPMYPRPMDTSHVRQTRPSAGSWQLTAWAFHRSAGKTGSLHRYKMSMVLVVDSFCPVGTEAPSWISTEGALKTNSRLKDLEFCTDSQPEPRWSKSHKGYVQRA